MKGYYKVTHRDGTIKNYRKASNLVRACGLEYQSTLKKLKKGEVIFHEWKKIELVKLDIKFED